MTALALGIDLGTSSVRSAVLDATGAMVAEARADYGMGQYDYRDPECWWTATVTCLGAQMAELARSGHRATDITRIGVDGTSGSLVLTDAALSPVTRALMYNDSGFFDQAELIAVHAPRAHIANGSGSALARALALVNEDKGKHAAHLLHQADFIAARLMGRGGMTDYNNALKTGLDPATGDWPDWMGRLPLPIYLRPVAHLPGTPLLQVSADTAKRFGLSSATIVHAGTTDSIAAFLACANQTRSAAVTSLGTTLAVKLFSKKRIDAPEMGMYAHRIGDGWLIGGASNTGGGVLKAFFSAEQLQILSGEIDPEIQTPLDYYPLLRPGERFPLNDPTLEPRLEPRPSNAPDFLHGMLEGIARIEKRAYEIMTEMGAGYPISVTTAGGGAMNQTWTRIRERVLGIPVCTAKTPEASFGTARLVQSFPA